MWAVGINQFSGEKCAITRSHDESTCKDLCRHAYTTSAMDRALEQLYWLCLCKLFFRAIWNVATLYHPLLVMLEYNPNDIYRNFSHPQGKNIIHILPSWIHLNPHNLPLLSQSALKPFTRTPRKQRLSISHPHCHPIMASASTRFSF